MKKTFQTEFFADIFKAINFDLNEIVLNDVYIDNHFVLALVTN